VSFELQVECSKDIYAGDIAPVGWAKLRAMERGRERERERERRRRENSNPELDLVRSEKRLPSRECSRTARGRLLLVDLSNTIAILCVSIIYNVARNNVTHVILVHFKGDVT